MQKQLQPEDWGLHTGSHGELMIGNHGTIGLARRFGTPLHVVHERRLMKTAAEFIARAAAMYPGTTSVHYAMKCNSVPAVVDAVLHAGMRVEVMTEYELALALRLGCSPEHIIVNGPCKTEAFLQACVEHDVRLIIADSFDELRDIDGVGHRRGKIVDVLVRVNPDYIPHGMNRGTATGSRKGCAFGFDLVGGEVHAALRLLHELPNVRFLGYHLHIGTGIRRPSDYARALESLRTLLDAARRNRFGIRILNVGGGFAASTTRELGTRELLVYQALDRLPRHRVESGAASVADYVNSITDAVADHFPVADMPELILEPGRCIASQNQFLLLTVQRVKVRPGIGRWLIADGGLSTVTLPTFYEYHEVFLCNDVYRALHGRATIIGPACFAGDVVYRNKPMPDVTPGEVIALMDSGAYFTAMESSFGFPRPAIVAVNGAQCRLVRARESFDDMIGRDVFD